MEWVSLKLQLVLWCLISHMFKIDTTPAPFSLITLQSLGLCVYFGVLNYDIDLFADSKKVLFL